MHRSNPEAPGIRRVRRGRGFSYLNPDGRPVTAERVLERIRGLAIPPAWRDVWICRSPNGHIQAVGTDRAGGRQYLYHPQWRAQRDAEKFARVERFGARLERTRGRLRGELAGEGLHRARVLAAAVSLLDIGFFRVGGDQYAKENGTFGLTTIRTEHVRLDGDEVVFEYVAKSHKERVQSVTSAPVIAVLRELLAVRPAQARLLAYLDGGEQWRDVRSADLNDHLHRLTRLDVSAKDFRTWNGTVLAAAALAGRADARTATARKRSVSAAMREVSGYLGNTPAVCRASYVDPRVLVAYEHDRTVPPAVARPRPGDEVGRRRLERAVLALLHEEGPAVAAPVAATR